MVFIRPVFSKLAIIVSKMTINVSNKLTFLYNFWKFVCSIAQFFPLTKMYASYPELLAVHLKKNATYSPDKNLKLIMSGIKIFVCSCIQTS